MNQKLYDAIIGFAIGDALGVPYEFKERGSFTCSDMTGYGTHYQPLGTWSDDTSMTLATLSSLKENEGRIIPEDMRTKFNYWLLYGDFTATGEVFDVGISTTKALRSGKPCIGEHDNGNGSLMRILPLAFVECNDDDIRNVSAITHGHWISMEACVILVHITKRLLDGETVENILPTLQYEKPFVRLSTIDKLDISRIKLSGYVVDTLEAALWAVSHKGDWRKCFKNDVLAAVNLGDDTDTVAAIAGGLAGIIYGLEADQKWVDALVNKKAIMSYLW